MNEDVVKILEELKGAIEENNRLLKEIKAIEEQMVEGYYYEADYNPEEDFEHFG